MQNGQEKRKPTISFTNTFIKIEVHKDTLGALMAQRRFNDVYRIFDDAIEIIELHKQKMKEAQKEIEDKNM